MSAPASINISPSVGATAPSPPPSGAGARVPVSVIILTKNEERNIADCLRHLDWADEVIIVDSYSDDGTLPAARDARPDVRMFEHAFEDFGRQRNWALDETAPRNAWILFLDADERATPEFAVTVEAAIRNPGEHVGYFASCRNFFLGRWIKRCTLYPSWQLRLLKAG